jgi:hypothetical protein
MPTPYDKLCIKQNKIQQQIQLLQAECKHPDEHVTRKNAGCEATYYDPPAYWIEFKCRYCGKMWMEDK